MTEYQVREMSDMHKDGKSRAYYKVQIKGNITAEHLADFMSTTSMGVSKSAIKAVLTQLSSSVAYYLGLGFSVTIDGIGTLSMKIGPKEGKEVEELKEGATKLTATNIEVTDINLRADKDFIREVNKSCRLERGGIKRLKKSSYTEAERLERAKAFMAKYGSMTLLDYVNVNEMSKTSAHRELHKFADDPESGITYIGRGPKREFVLDKKKLNG